MIRKLYNVFYMFRMIKDKVCDQIISYYYNTHVNTVKRMNESQYLIKDIYNLSNSINLIIDNIYIGNAYSSSNYYILNENNIGLIVNVTEEIPNYYENFNNEFEYIQIKIKDHNDKSLFEYLELSLSKINTYIKNHPNKNILIHCYMGASRSATILSAYLIKYYNLNVEDSIQLIKSKRDLVNINTSFIEDLNQFYITQQNNN